MPIYEYACPACGHEFEKILKVNDPAPPCPSCASVDVQKKMSLAAFHLKGGGWYADAYAGKDNKPASGKAEAPAAPAAKAESTDSKPAAKESTPKAAATPKATKTT